MDENAISCCKAQILCAVCVQIQTMQPEEALHQPWLWNAIGSCVCRDRLRYAAEVSFSMRCERFKGAVCKILTPLKHKIS